MQNIMNSQNFSPVTVKEKIVETKTNTSNDDIGKQNAGVSNKKLMDDSDNTSQLLINQDKTTTDNKTDAQIANARKRKRARKRYKKNKALRIAKEKEESVAEVIQCSSSSECSDEHGMIVSNLPNNWSYIQIKNYIDKECGPVDEMEMLKDNSNTNGSIRLSFQNEQECKKALEKLSGKEIEGTKIVAEIVVLKDKSDSESMVNVTDASGNKKRWRPDLDIWEVDPKGLYGLKLQYLKSLDIEPPLDKWVHVSNFRCDKSELRDIMELAGQVVFCSVFTVANKYAKVMYSHPLEAVQAVSMLNCQMFYGKSLIVTIDKCPANTIILPKGLSNIGLGLGKTGRPLRNIVRHYERFLNNQSSLVNPVIFDVDAKNVADGVSNDMKQETKSDNEEPLTKSEDIIEFKVMNVAELKTFIDENTEAELNQIKQEQPTDSNADKHSGSKTSKVINQKQNVQPKTSPTIGTKNIQNNSNRPQLSLVRPTRPVGPNAVAPVVRPLYPAQNHQFPGPLGCFIPGPGPIGPISSDIRPLSGPMNPAEPRLWGPGAFEATGPRPLLPLNSSGVVGPRPLVSPGQAPIPGPGGPQIFPVSESATVLLSNLPPSTTFPLLCEKLSNCGQVLSLQLTTPGCAVVTFSRPIHAEICFKNFNGMNAEGYIINVTLM